DFALELRRGLAVALCAEADKATAVRRSLGEAPNARRRRSVYSPAVPSSSLQALLSRAGTALERGRGPEAAQLLAPALRSAGLTREDELAVRSALAEAWLLQDDLEQAATALGRTPDTFRDTISAARLSTLWRL